MGNGFTFNLPGRLSSDIRTILSDLLSLQIISMLRVMITCNIASRRVASHCRPLIDRDHRRCFLFASSPTAPLAIVQTFAFFFFSFFFLRGKAVRVPAENLTWKLSSDPTGPPRVRRPPAARRRSCPFRPPAVPVPTPEYLWATRLRVYIFGGRSTIRRNWDISKFAPRASRHFRSSLPFFRRQRRLILVEGFDRFFVSFRILD